MRVVVVGSWAPSLIQFRGALLADMRDLGHEVHAFATEANEQTLGRLAELGVTYHDVPLERTGMNPMADARTLGCLVRSFRQLRPHVFLGYTAKPVIYGALAARMARVPYVHALITGLGYSFQGQGSRRRDLLNRLVRAMYRQALRGATSVFFQNPDDHALFRDLRLIGPEARTTLLAGSGVDTEHYGYSPMPTHSTTFLMIARLLREKGVIEFAEAARLVRRLHPETRFVLVGPFDQHPNAIPRGLVGSWVQEGLIEHVGEVDDVRPFIREATVYVLPSYREGTPRSVLEAMSMGRPIITTDAPGCRETVVDGLNGLLVPANDAKALADAMLDLLRQPDLRAKMGKTSRDLAVSRFDVRLVNREMLHVLGLCDEVGHAGNAAL